VVLQYFNPKRLVYQIRGLFQLISLLKRNFLRKKPVFFLSIPAGQMKIAQLMGNDATFIKNDGRKKSGVKCKTCHAAFLPRNEIIRRS